MIKYTINEETKYFDLRFEDDVEALKDAVYCDFYDIDYSIIEKDEDAYMAKFEEINHYISKRDEEKLLDLQIDGAIQFQKVPKIITN